MRQLTYKTIALPLAKAFVIARGARTQTDVIQVQILEGNVAGRAECVPYGRYGESLDSVTEQIKSIRPAIESGINRTALQDRLPPGAARNAIDCALWDLEAKLNHTSVSKLTAMGNGALISCQTLSIDSPEKMAQEASIYNQYPRLKIKLDREHVIERIHAIHRAAPNADFIIDANESWSIDELNQYWPELAKNHVSLIEQPLHADRDQDLIHYQGSIPICADESCHSSADIPQLTNRYQAINIKLDKTGGLTEAIKLYQCARQANLLVMVGCMVGSSLAMAPASLIASQADYVDLDGPALLAQDIAHGFQFNRGQMSPLNSNLWGGMS